ncbi:unnamed protein product [Urochloa humidicola]
MNSRPYHQFQLQAAEAASAAAVMPPVHAADDIAPPEPPTPKALHLELVEAQVTADAPPPLPPQQVFSVAPMGGVGIAEPTKCPECPKWFVSEKAMFGHLRKHPERGYKGATRPVTVATAAAAAAATLAVEKIPKKPLQLARNQADVSAMNMMVAAATAGKKKKPLENATAELSTKWPVTTKRGHSTTGKQQASSDDEDEEAAMILLGMASSSHSTTSEIQQASVQEQAVHAPDAASGHQPMLLDDHVAGDHLTPPLEAEQIVQPAGIVIELSAESQTPVPAVKEIENVEVCTEALNQVVAVPANKPVTFTPGSGSSSGGGANKKAKKQRRGVVYLEQAPAAVAPAPPPEGADGGSRPSVWRLPLPASNKRHVCPTCGKWFSTYQALGGHMSSHVKAKAGAAAAHEELAAAQARHNILVHRSVSGGGGGLVLAASSAAVGATAGAGASWSQGLHLQDVHHQPPALMAAAPPHVCVECHMTFRTGQALGGHMRKHWFPEKHQAKVAAPAVEPAVPAPRDFDLNELPEEGEGENEQP